MPEVGIVHGGASLRCRYFDLEVAAEMVFGAGLPDPFMAPGQSGELGTLVFMSDVGRAVLHRALIPTLMKLSRLCVFCGTRILRLRR